ncbi:MAG TPA: bifunctional diguanylate cyclase/phosphodiesterase [Thermoanaerobaculia bacterium]|nr:bifunctional diguanylate cyclase/phosphodiesterase [Thermoanaerobaculia bacterium]
MTSDDIDGLTSLPNRRFFLEQLERVIAEARAQRFDLAVLAVDVDRFRKVNGSLGYRVGDKVLETVASRLQQSLRPHDTVARSAGDEFLVLLPGTPWRIDVEVVVRTLLSVIAQPMEIDGYLLNVTATIGAGVFPRDGLDAESLVQHAATALHRAKRRFERYSATDARSSASPFLESGLRRAVERGEFALHYQPIVDLDSRRVSGAEALIRWEHPHLGTLPPACFLGLAEETGTSIPLATWAVREAFEQAARWEKRNVPIDRIAVNISAHQLREPDFAGAIGRIADDARIDPRRIELEVTESALIADDCRGVVTLHELRARGFGIAIDDFGTGYSSLSYLQRLPVDRLKIDRAFVRDLGSSEQSAAIAELIISVGQRLGLRVTAEGVETAQQLEFLRAHGCDEIQGYYLGEPGPATTIEHAVIRPPAAHLQVAITNGGIS